VSGGYDIALWILLIIAAVTDIAWGKIFNLLTFPFMVVGLALRYWGHGSDALVHSVIALVAAFLFFYPLFLLHAFAAGDVKLLMAVGAWSNVSVVVNIAAIGIIIGAVVGAVILVKNRGLVNGLKSVGKHLRLKPEESQRIPFAPAFLCAFMFMEVAEIYQWSLF